MDGSATHPPLPAMPQQPPVVVQNNGGGPAAVIEAGGTFISRLGNFSPQQAQTAAVLVLTLFVCAVVGYLMWTGQRTQAETLAIVIRSMESEAEKNRAANSAEFERNRAAFASESKASRDSITDSAKLTIASHQKLATELGKLEQVVTTLSSSINELKRKLPPQEIDFIPPPRLKGLRGEVSGRNPRPEDTSPSPDRADDHP